MSARMRLTVDQHGDVVLSYPTTAKVRVTRTFNCCYPDRPSTVFEILEREGFFESVITHKMLRGDGERLTCPGRASLPDVIRHEYRRWRRNRGG